VRALEDFKNNRIIALVATEVAARGLDIKELPYVVNYELPNVPEDYVHRIGRTARAGSTGMAISLVSPDESPFLKDIVKLLGRDVPTLPLPQFEMRDSGPAEQSGREGAHRGDRGAIRRIWWPVSGRVGRPTGRVSGRRGARNRGLAFTAGPARVTSPRRT
jgi:ATP-dependent RNA helicase RhlE